MSDIVSTPLPCGGARGRVRIIVLTGAGMSAESGISTFRDSGGLWEQYKVEDVATPEGWARDPELVTEFYNLRRQQMLDAQPCLGHKLLAELERFHDVQIITQNVDDLHERGGSTNIIHLHGEATKARSEFADYSPTYDIGYKELNLGDLAPDGGQLRPHIVWFGEAVPELSRGAKAVEKADILIIIGTSLNVYPAAGLVHYAKKGCRIYLIDPAPMNLNIPGFQQIQAPATEGMRQLLEIL